MITIDCPGCCDAPVIPSHNDCSSKGCVTRGNHHGDIRFPFYIPDVLLSHSSPVGYYCIPCILYRVRDRYRVTTVIKMQGNPPASIPALLRIAPEIRNKIIALATSDPADVTKLTLHPRGLVVMSEHYDLIDISFWNGSLCMVCKQLLNEIRAFLTSSITWAFRHAYMRDISQFPRRYYLEHTKTVEITDNLSFEFPFPLFNNLKEIHLGRIHESNAHYELSSDPIEAIRQIDWCIGDFSFISRAQERLLKRESIKSLLKRSKERFLVKETINIGGRWEFLNEEMKNNLVRMMLAWVPCICC